VTVTSPTFLGRPRPLPKMAAPIAAGSAVVALALPIFVVAGWSLKGWVLGAVLWAASMALGLILLRLRLGADSLMTSGVAAFGLVFRGIAVMVVAIAVAAAQPDVGLAAALVYALAYTLELAVSVLAYFAGEPR
jgi:fructose-specific component phosphotransferase system IIB-like protein